MDKAGGDPGTGPGKLHSGKPGFLPAGILGTGVPFSVDPGNRGSFRRGSRGRCPAWGSPYRKLSFSRGKGAVPRTRPEVLHSGEPGYVLAGIQRLVFCLGSGGIQYLSHRSSNPAIPVPLRPEPHSEPGGGPVPSLQTGGWRY
ncbi:hypothetical protein F2Q69_00006412 [Brassica cretica]|uniref:Uncharacterized protein n=1 Tax=Brassica cretica TaxID=69181 RepID=A0A8S9NZK2_BRACR|nr:hypothetical protein F2Q69_00006412 [Brassica cretica]